MRLHVSHVLSFVFVTVFARDTQDARMEAVLSPLLIKLRALTLTAVGADSSVYGNRVQPR